MSADRPVSDAAVRALESFDRAFFGSAREARDPSAAGEPQPAGHPWPNAFAGLAALRDALDADDSSRRMPAEWRTPAGERACLDRIRDAALEDLERAASWSAELSDSAVPESARFDAERRFQQIFERLVAEREAALEDAHSGAGTIAEELRHAFSIPEDVAAEDFTADVAASLTPRIARDVSDGSAGTAASAAGVEHRSDAVAVGSGSPSAQTGSPKRVHDVARSPRRTATRLRERMSAPGWLWARIRSDLSAHRRSLRTAQRIRLASRIALAAALIFLLLAIWPERMDPSPRHPDRARYHIEIIESSRPFDARFSPVAALRSVHEGSVHEGSVHEGSVHEGGVHDGGGREGGGQEERSR
ncbi:MAG: hypothetical protein IPM29_31635 [Planctomycetes bacterium]|nr:hypothetical protein [Planctomycetota bacterium]